MNLVVVRAVAALAESAVQVVKTTAAAVSVAPAATAAAASMVLLLAEAIVCKEQVTLATGMAWEATLQVQEVLVVANRAESLAEVQRALGAAKVKLMPVATMSLAEVAAEEKMAVMVRVERRYIEQRRRELQRSHST